MRKKEEQRSQFEYKRGWRRAIVIITWFFCLGFLLYLYNLNYKNPSISTQLHFCEDISFGSNNTLGKLQIIKYLKDTPSQKEYSVSLKNIKTDSRTVGIFKTPLTRTVQIQNLCLNYYIYKPNARLDGSTENMKLFPEYLSSSGLLGSYIADFQKRYRNFSVGIDLGNITKIRIFDFEYNLIDKANTTLSVNAKLANTDSKSTKLELRGHAKITNKVGDTLQSNRIIWDIENKCFTAVKYCLTRQGKKIMGNSIKVDYELNELSVINNMAKIKEISQCYARNQ